MNQNKNRNEDKKINQSSESPQSNEPQEEKEFSEKKEVQQSTFQEKEKENDKSSQKSSTGLKENEAGALAYVLGWVTGLIFFLIEKKSEKVKFHAVQAIIFSVALMVIGWIPIVGWLASIAGLVVGIFLIIKAYQGKKYKLPIIGDFAEEQARKSMEQH